VLYVTDIFKSIVNLDVYSSSLHTVVVTSLVIVNSLDQEILMQRYQDLNVISCLQCLRIKPKLEQLMTLNFMALKRFS